MSVIVDELTAARQRTVDLLAPFDDDFLRAQHAPIMSPLVWDLAHVGNYEEQWLVRALGGDPIGAHLDDLYDAFRHPRPNRPSLPLLSPADAREYITDVRERVVALVDGGPRIDDTRLLDNDFVYGMVIQHEHQHDETMLATIQLSGAPFAPMGTPARVADTGDVLVAVGTALIGTDDEAWAYDNERPAHHVEVAPFRIDVAPVTNGAYREFVAAGGYDDERLWHPDGWSWRHREGASAPLFWNDDGTVTRFGARALIRADEPVQHVSWFEADAFARWAGRRLPTEQEWETAARAGALRHIGEVWEWTASGFDGWPGFRSFPYREYSEVFIGGDYRVLRGGSWATHPTARRLTFRNWDHPIRRQIFSGLRLAGDA
jgi:iron(II)-dependent oxidoreductase